VYLDGLQPAEGISENINVWKYAENLRLLSYVISTLVGQLSSSGLFIFNK
jgi:hypothetical protein